LVVARCARHGIAAAIYLCIGLIVIKSVLALPIGGVLATSGIVAIVLGLALQRLPTRQVLSELVLLESLDPALIDQPAQQAVTRLLEPEETLFAEGAADCTLHVVASGVMEVTKASESGAVVTLGRLGAGEYLGEIGLLTGAPHAATARARTHCYVHQLSRAAIAPLLAADPGMAAAFDQSVRRGPDYMATFPSNIAISATDSGERLENSSRACLASCSGKACATSKVTKRDWLRSRVISWISTDLPVKSGMALRTGTMNV
jgi:Cyclic nucleotide-binding domain